VFLYLLTLLLALACRVNFGYFLKRTWIFIPLFSLFIGLPAVFGPGRVLFTWYVFGVPLKVTHQGVQAAAVFVMRVATCVSWAVLLSITTQHFILLKALRFFRLPQVFIMVLGMCYRYIYLFVTVIQNTYLAIKSRIGIRLPCCQGQKIVAWNIASLWNRSLVLNEEVYKAMLARGYQGEALAWDDFKIRARDYLWLAAVAALIWII